MKYQILGFEWGASPSDVVTKVLVATDSREAYEAAIARMTAGPVVAGVVVPRAGRPGRAVRVVGLEATSMVSGVWVGDVFESAQAATQALYRGGVEARNYNLALKQLAAVAGKANPAERFAVVEGVTLQYQDDFEAAQRAAALENTHVD